MAISTLKKAEKMMNRGEHITLEMKSYLIKQYWNTKELFDRLYDVLHYNKDVIYPPPPPTNYIDKN